MAQTAQPGTGPDLSTIITRFYGGTVDQAQPAFRLNSPGSQPGWCLLWNDPGLINPPNAPWRRILAVWASVTTSAVVKNRQPTVQFTDNAVKYYYKADSSYNIAASQAAVWITAALNGPMGNNVASPFQGHGMFLPDIWWPPGSVFAFGLNGFDPGDTMNEARIMVQEAGPILQSYGVGGPSANPSYLYGQHPTLTG